MFYSHSMSFNSVLSQSSNPIIVHENDIDMIWMKIKFQQQDHASMRQNNVHSNSTM